MIFHIFQNMLWKGVGVVDSLKEVCVFQTSENTEEIDDP